MLRRAAILTVLVTLAASCSSDAGKGKSNGNGDPNNGANNADNADNSTDDGKPSDGLDPVDGPVERGNAGSVISDRVCDAYETCRCGEIAGVSLANCRQGLQFSWQARLEDAQERGLTYDAACVADRVNAMADRGCAVLQRYNQYCDGETCQVFYGSKGIDEDCDGGFNWSDCQQGLVCIGTCQVPCSNAVTAGTVGEGEVCRTEEDGYIAACELGLLCDPEDGLCASLPGVGEPCLASQCEEGLWCNAFDGQPAICEPTLPEGRECRSPLECDSVNCADAVCGPPLQEGEPCTTKCADGLTCVSDGVSQRVCTPTPQQGDPCLPINIERCGSDLTCVGGTCEPKPKIGEPCPPDDNNLLPTCEDGAVCGQRICSVTPDAPGCDACSPDDTTCGVFVCIEIPPQVCNDSGGLLY